MVAATLLDVCKPAIRLEVISVGDRRLVRLNGRDIADYRRDDLLTERLVATQLAETLDMEARVIAVIFGMHPVTLSRFRSQVRDGGGRSLVPRKTGPKGPHKVTAEVVARVLRLKQEGLSSRAIAQRMTEAKQGITNTTVLSILKAAPVASPRSEELPFEEPVPETRVVNEIRADEPPVDEAPALKVSGYGEAPAEESASAPSPVAGEARHSRYAGAFLLFASLHQLDLWGILRSLGTAAGPSRRWDWAETVSAVVLAFALRFRSVEDSKNVLRDDFGVLLGQPRSPSLLTLREKIAAVTESLDPVALTRALFRRYLKLEPVWEGLYYLDGHFCPYYGEHATPKGWDAKRRLGAPGHTDEYVHDARGRVLFFLSQPLNDSLARAVPALVREIRQVHGPGPFTIVFDRGGYSGEVFRFLRAEGIGFITYLKGRKARRRYPRQRFRQGWFPFEGNRQQYCLYEKGTRVTGAGLVRTVLFLGDDGHQIPVLTNLDARCRAAKVVHCLRLRWRQENSFKYLTENYGIDQIIQYGADPEQEERRVQNPRRKALKERIGVVETEIQALEASLGRTLDQNQGRQRLTARELKMATGPVRRQLDLKRQALVRLASRLQRTPTRIDAATVEKTRSLLREDRRVVVNTLKLVAHNAERMLALRFNKYYERPQDAFSVFRALLHLPGEVRRTGHNQLVVRLDRPDSGKVAQALVSLLADINKEDPRLPDGGHVSFALRD